MADPAPTSPAVVSTAHWAADLTVSPAGHGYSDHGGHGYGGPGFGGYRGPDPGFGGFGYYRHWWPWRW
jgi:hypothetical protein